MDILLERIIECIGPRHGAKKELAEHLGIHPNVITNWLNGRNKSYRRYVNEIAAFYGVSVDYLLGNADSKEKQPDSQNENQAVKDELIAFYGDVKDDLTPDDIDDLMSKEAFSALTTAEFQSSGLPSMLAIRLPACARKLPAMNAAGNTGPTPRRLKPP